MKKDIFHGKIKQEYFSYILVYMIFFVLLFVGIGVLCICVAVWDMTSNTWDERFLIASFGVIAFVLAGVYVFLEMLVIRGFPKYAKIRRILFNSDIYFTESTSDEYLGGRRRKYRSAFDAVTAFAEVEKGMGKKKPVLYKVYLALSIIMSVVGLVSLIAMPFLYENGTVFSNVSQSVFLFCYISVGFVCIALDILFLSRALKVAIMAPLENYKWIYELYSSLVDIAVRKNNKKLKFWYDIDQLEQIDSLVKSASENAELKLETKGSKIVSFTVVDTLNNSVRFKGLFTK